MKTEGLESLLNSESPTPVYSGAGDPFGELILKAKERGIYLDDSGFARKNPISGLTDSLQPDLVQKKNTTKGWDEGTLGPEALRFVEGRPRIPEPVMKALIRFSAQSKRPPRKALFETVENLRDGRKIDWQETLYETYAKKVLPIFVDQWAGTLMDLANDRGDKASRLRKLEDYVTNNSLDTKIRFASSCLICVLRDLPVVASEHLISLVGVADVPDLSLEAFRSRINNP